jgi:hypothetical protein
LMNLIIQIGLDQRGYFSLLPFHKTIRPIQYFWLERADGWSPKKLKLGFPGLRRSIWILACGEGRIFTIHP